MMGDCNLIPQTKALEVHHRLVRVYGEPRPQPRDPIATLVSTILSQNTNDALRDRAFRQLRERFPTWEEVRDAPVHEIAQAIQVAGLGGQKAQRIKASLARISQERGELRLDFLRQMPVGESRRWLLSFNGIGPKTAAILLLFALDVPAFPVDTHIHRVSKRLGLIPPTASREKAHEILEALMPPETYYTFHINVIRHGREVCGARRPRCELCVLRDLCTWYANPGRGIQAGRSRPRNRSTHETGRSRTQKVYSRRPRPPRRKRGQQAEDLAGGDRRRTDATRFPSG